MPSSEVQLILKDYLYITLNQQPQARELITVKWQARMKWNYLPDVLWLSIWNYLNQKEYRCAAIQLNRYSIYLAKMHSCRTRSSIHLTKRHDAYDAKQLLLRLAQPIVELKLYTADVFHCSCPETLYPALQHVQRLDLSLPYAVYRELRLNTLISVFQNMPVLRALYIDASIINPEFALCRTDELRLFTSLIQLEELHVTFETDKEWLFELLKLPHLRILSVKNLNIQATHLNKLSSCLEQLTFEQYKLYSTGFISNQLAQLPNLKRLIAGECFYKDSSSFILRGLKELDKIEYLSLERWTLHDSTFLISCAFVANLQHLSIRKVQFSILLLKNLSKCINLISLAIGFDSYSSNDLMCSELSTLTWCKNLQCVYMHTESSANTTPLHLISWLCCTQSVHLQHLELYPAPKWWTPPMFNHCFQTHCHCYTTRDSRHPKNVGGHFNASDGLQSFQALLQSNIMIQ